MCSISVAVEEHEAKWWTALLNVLVDEPNCFVRASIEPFKAQTKVQRITKGIILGRTAESNHSSFQQRNKHPLGDGSKLEMKVPTLSYLLPCGTF
jgi:hypothetical protein